MADTGKAPEGFPRRMQAARALAGLTIEQLAEQLSDEPGFGDRTLRNIENGSASAPGSKRRTIIEACGLPPAFIDADMMILEAAYDGGLSKMPAELRKRLGDEYLVTRAFRLLAEQPDHETLNDRIARLEHQLAVLTQAEADGEPPHLAEHFRGAEDEAPPQQAPGQTQS